MKKTLLMVAAALTIILGLTACDGWLNAVHSTKIQDQWHCQSATVHLTYISCETGDTLNRVDSVITFLDTDKDFDIEFQEKAVIYQGGECGYKLINDSIEISPRFLPFYLVRNMGVISAYCPDVIVSGIHMLSNLMTLDHEFLTDSLPDTQAGATTWYRIAVYETVMYESLTKEPFSLSSGE